MCERVVAQTLQNGLFVLDARTGTTLGKFKKCSANSCSLCFISASPCSSSQVVEANHIVVADSTQPFIHFLRVNNLDGQPQSFSVPEKIISLAFSSCGSFCIGGGISGTIFVWCTPTGQLIKRWKGHFRSIVSLAISSNDSFLFTASEDAAVCCYTMDEVLYSCDEFGEFHARAPNKLQRWTSHSLPIVSLCLAYLNNQNNVAITGSLDRTVNVWKVHSEAPLVSYNFPCHINHVQCNPVTLEVYVCAADTKIYIFDLGQLLDRDITGDLCKLPKPACTPEEAFLGHSAPVSCCSVNADGTMLVSSGEDGIRIWDIYSRQTINYFSTLRNSVTAVHFFTASYFDFSSNSNQKTDTEINDLILCNLSPLRPFMRNPITRNPDIVFCKPRHEKVLSQEIYNAINYARNNETNLHFFLRSIREIATQQGFSLIRKKSIQVQREQEETRRTVVQFFKTLCSIDKHRMEEKTKVCEKSNENAVTWLQNRILESSVQSSGNPLLLENHFPYIDKSFAPNTLRNNLHRKASTLLLKQEGETSGSSFQDSDTDIVSDESMSNVSEDFSKDSLSFQKPRRNNTNFSCKVQTKPRVSNQKRRLQKGQTSYQSRHPQFISSGWMSRRRHLMRRMVLIKKRFS